MLNIFFFKYILNLPKILSILMSYEKHFHHIPRLKMPLFLFFYQLLKARKIIDEGNLITKLVYEVKYSSLYDSQVI